MNEHSFIFVIILMRARDENKEIAIRQKAVEMIVKEGLDGLSMQKLAKAAGVSPATIYIYYKDREDLIIQLALYASEKLTCTSLENFDAEMSFEEGMKVQWRNRARFFTENPTEMLFVEQIKHSQHYEKFVEANKGHFREVMTRFTRKAIQNKELIELPFEAYWSIAFGPLYQLIKFHSEGHSYGNRQFQLSDELMMQTLHLVLKALKP